jgi:hypothetical protein
MPSRASISIASRRRLERWFAAWSFLWRQHAPIRSASQPPQQPAESSPPEPAPPPASPARPVVLVTVLGLSGSALHEVLELVTKDTRAKPIAPVFITDSLDFTPFRQRRLRFEYLPDRGRQQRFAPELEWDLYLRRRYGLLSEKWQTKSIISFGRPPPRECVANGRPAHRQRAMAPPQIHVTEENTMKQGHHEIP